MKPVSPELLALLSTREFYVADLYTFSGGNLGPAILRYCAGDADITANALLYSAGGQTGPYFDRSSNKAKIHQKVGLEVDTLTFDMIPGLAQVFGGSIMRAVRFGIFDGASLLLERAFMPTYGDTRCGTVRSFFGRVASIDTGRSLCTFSVSSHLELLNLAMPHNLYQAGCVNTLGDRACGIDLNSSPYNATTGVIEVGSSLTQLLVTLTNTVADGIQNQGKITFTTGDLTGLSATIRGLVNGTPAQISLLGYLPKAPDVGDAFTVYWGCDKTYDGAQGCLKFNNQPRFRGEPVVPQPVSAI